MTEIENLRDPSPQTECRRCGTCCRKGGPALHLDDQKLVETGIIPLSDLFTIRQGEPALDNIDNTIAPAVTDIIMIKGLPDNRPQCRYYDYDTKGCRIYDRRPLECRALNCRDTREIERIYSLRRLTRRHLLSNVEGLWTLVQDHQSRCDYGCVAELAADLKRPHTAREAAESLLELIRFDDELRILTAERSSIDSQILPFLFGRPLSSTIGMFRLRLTRTRRGPVIEPLGDEHRQVCYRRQKIPS
jgi:Fe-S-cluster containining protein